MPHGSIQGALRAQACRGVHASLTVCKHTHEAVVVTESAEPASGGRRCCERGSNILFLDLGASMQMLIYKSVSVTCIFYGFFCGPIMSQETITFEIIKYILQELTGCFSRVGLQINHLI